MAALPSGTVTFLFTDIEGSTRLWETHPEAMNSALARHDALLRAIVAEHGGATFKTAGDSTHAAFAMAPDALNAAVAAQAALRAESWGVTGPLRVRMALHTGTAVERDGDYFGPPLNRVARILAAGHGEQVLLSLATQELVRDHLPEGVTLRDMGERRLKDLVRPERIFQVIAPSLRLDFPPLRCMDAFPNNLPIQVTSFIGRDREMAEVKRLLGRTRLLTLTGVGGTGKSRLSLQVAADLSDRFPDGIWLVELAPISDPALVPQAVAAALGVRIEAERPITTVLIDALKTRTLLIVLDNCEHVLEASAHLATALLRGCPSVHLLATSREALAISGETTWPVPSLSLPAPDQLGVWHAGAASEGGDSLSTLTQYEAVRLFIERALTVQPSFAISNTNAPAVAEICHRLDGIPLAIELAAARVRVLSPEAIAKRLDDRFRLLTGGSRTALPRQQTLRALVDWSYDLLSPTERLLFARLSVFQGGWLLPAAEAVCGGEGLEAWEIFDTLLQLVNKSLAVAEAHQGETRYGFLETMRQYARDRLFELGQGSALRDAHLDYFTTLAEAEIPGLRGPDQIALYHRLAEETDNVRAALEWATGSGDVVRGLRLAVAWTPMMEGPGYHAEARDRLRALLSHPDFQTAPMALRAEALRITAQLASGLSDYPEARRLFAEALSLSRELDDPSLIAAVLTGQGVIAQGQADYESAERLYQESLALLRAHGSPNATADTLRTMGNLAWRRGRYQEGKALLEESEALYRQMDDKAGVAYALSPLGIIALAMGDEAAAIRYTEESLHIFREMGEKRRIANQLNTLAEIARHHGDFERAMPLYQQSLKLCEETGNRWSVAMIYFNIACIHRNQGDPAKAEGLFRQSMTIYQELENREGIAFALAGLAWLRRSHNPEEATRLLAAAVATLEAVGAGLLPGDRADFEREKQALEAALPPAIFQAAWEAGRAMTFEEAVALAR